MNILDYVKLPPTISDFERSYLQRVNVYAAAFLILNVPVFVVIAALNRTGAALALAFSSFVVAGPVVAAGVLANPRHVSYVFAVAGACMGGLLVHFGQGPMQIEMHFYFFVIIALLTIFGNPTAVLIAAATTAAHHTVIYLLFPTSVFNYAASMGVVAVHATFVVVESVACCFVARSFFDNVIGLERIVEQRTRQLAARTADTKLMLDNVGQGFLRVMLDGTVAAERSAIVERWFGPMLPEETAAAYLGRTDPGVRAWFASGLESFVDDVLPVELSLAQMPGRMVAGDRALSLAYRAIEEAGKVTSLLVIVSDVTAEVARADAEAIKVDIMAMVERMLADRAGFAEFMADARGLVTAVASGTSELAETRRHVHTLKGNALLAGMTGFAAVCHALESHIDELGDLPDAAHRAALVARWRATTERVEALLGMGTSAIEVSEADLQALSAAIAEGRSRPELLDMLDELRLEPNERRLQKIADDARSVAARLGRDVVVEVRAASVRLSRERWAPLWSAAVHILRNALDHGIESPNERRLALKAARGRLVLSTRFDGPDYVIAFADDGRGVDWAKIAGIAAQRGIPHGSREELTRVLFADGVSTREEVSEHSGRGVGMSAVLAVTSQLGGDVRVESVAGEGTRVELRFPRAAVRERAPIERIVSANMRAAAPASRRSVPASA